MRTDDLYQLPADLLAYFQLHTETATNLSAQTRRELGLRIKASNNEMAAKFSRGLGLKQIQAVLNSSHFYHTNHGGGIWIGKQYGGGGERYGDPIGNNSHAATVRQLIRFFLILEQGKLVSPAASKTMREIFESPEIPHDDIKFVRGLPVVTCRSSANGVRGRIGFMTPRSSQAAEDTTSWSLFQSIQKAMSISSNSQRRWMI